MKTKARTNPIQMREKLAYGLGSFGKDFIMAMLSTYLLIFYTDVFGINAATAGTIILFARIWDAVNDPMIGAIADRTRTRWGRFRPYILLVPVPFVVLTVLTFTVPSLPMSGKIAWAAVTYIGTGMLFSAYDVPLWAMVPNLAKNEVSRNQLIAFARTFTVIAFLVINVLALPLISMLGGGNDALGYRRLMMILGIVSVIFAWVAFFSTKERIEAPKSSPTVRDYFAMVKTNPTLFILLLVVIIPNFGKSISGAVGVYAMTYWIGKPELIPVYMLFVLTGVVVGMVLTPSIVRRTGNRKAVIAAMLASPLPMIALFFLAPVSLAALLFLYFVGAALSGIPLVAIPAMIANIADDSASKNKVRTDGVIFSLNSFSIKVGLALGGGTAGFALGWSNYIPNSPTQPDSALLTISLLWTVVPGLLSFVGALLLIRFGRQSR
ncbi:MAG: hypothetical protein GY866_04750 [Proteobacteria bacterium]|nr:hypothetical protein [Pseudomonadota bacterium]